MANLMQGRCPKCPSSDAYTQYPDGSAYCFSCNSYWPAENSLAVLRRKLEGRSFVKAKSKVNNYPEDVTNTIPKEPLTWLKSYGITSQEIIDNEYVWSPMWKALIVSSKDIEQNVIFWQGRFFPKKEPKVVGFGQKDHLKFGGTETGRPDVLVLVEDFVSAIKVNRFQTCLCLFGSHISSTLILRLRNLGYNKLVVWLDPNKSKESLSYSRRYGMLFKQGVVSIVSTKDPKEHSNQEIKDYLDKAF